MKKTAAKKFFPFPPKIFLPLLFASLLFFFAFVCADSVDINSTSTDGTGASASSSNFVTWVTVEQGVAGSAEGIADEYWNGAGELR